MSHLPAAVQRPPDAQGAPLRDRPARRCCQATPVLLAPTNASRLRLSFHRQIPTGASATLSAQYRLAVYLAIRERWLPRLAHNTTLKACNKPCRSSHVLTFG